LTDRLEQAREKSERLASEVEQQKIRVAELSQQLHETQLQNAELPALREQLAQDQLALSDLRQQLEQANAQVARVTALEAQIAKLHVRLERQKTQLTAARKKAASAARVKKGAQRARAALVELRKQLTLARRQIRLLQTQSQKREAMIVDLTTRLYRIRQAEAENLERIKGIGPKYAAQLRAGGITSLATLANADVAQLQEIIQPRRWQKPAFQSWIQQAQRLSRTAKAKTR